nr:MULTISPECIES: site-specific integrase [unclassified Novosphingobium]
MKPLVGKGEIWVSLKTDSFRMARRRVFGVLAKIESEFEIARSSLGKPVDSALLSLANSNTKHQSQGSVKSAEFRHASDNSDIPIGLTFGEVYERFMSDPTQDWAPRTRLAYQTTQRLAVSIIGSATPMVEVNRALCREFLEALRFLPKGASRAFPDLSAKQASEKARLEGLTNLISAANINTYLNKLCVVLNWAVREEFLGKNYLKGLRVADPVGPRDKRFPFDNAQLEAIFSAPLYVGCVNDCEGYGKRGTERPKGTRFWVPLIGLWQGLRLNEICQLDTTDIREIDGVECIIVTTDSLNGSKDKRLKTENSQRIVPVHPHLIGLGLMDFVLQAQISARKKLFEDINPGAYGARSTAFSKWFIQFLGKENAVKPRTSFHSFRHNYRDALRQAGVDREVAMALGGWGSGSKMGLDVSDHYGRGYQPRFLRDQVSRIDFDDVPALLRLCKTASKRA